MTAAVQVVEVPAPQFLDQAISAYITQGFTVANRTPYSVTMIKPKKFEVLWAVIGFIFCILPLLVYLIVYATQKDQVIEIRVAQHAAPTPQMAPAPLPAPFHMSPDGTAWWDGTGWVPASVAAPPTAHRSDDGRAWWDGQRWHSIGDPFHL